MADWTAPAKINLSLELGSVDGSGYHPLRSLVQTIDWLDHLTVEASDEDRLEIEGAALPHDGDNLVWRAVEALAPGSATGPAGRPRLDIRLIKRIGVAAGLGGGSSDAAAALSATAEIVGRSAEDVARVAPAVGADVPLFLVGGTLMMEGRGERISPLRPLAGFAVGVVVPPFELSTPIVYRTWDRLGEPRGRDLPDRGLPPALRAYGGLRNDLTPAALHLESELSDWIADMEKLWGRPVAMSGSGPSLFAFFADLDEASAAAREAPLLSRAAMGADLRPFGVAKVG